MNRSRALYAVLSARKGRTVQLPSSFVALPQSINLRYSRLYSSSIGRLFSSDSGPSLTAPSQIIEDCLKLRESVQAFNDKVKGPLEKNSQQNTILPFVFLLGNHSSGKSSFVNYVCQRKIQTAGVAPTDDNFTIIMPGPADKDRDGPGLVGDPDMGFNGLRPFGPQLIHHTQLKVRSNLAIKNFMIVDSPGMIDSPMVRDLNGNIRHAVMDRGFDFEGVCRWYAERADVILLFFDPDKPGTTGETLQILTNSLMGLDHKLHILLNKADQFRKIHDFARAYGSLCWNLSKVIQRKDLPRIYTMCLPTSFQARASGDQSGEGQSLGQGLIDLEDTREEVVKEVLNAPNRRVDNEISRLLDHVSLLQMHSKIINDISSTYKKKVFKYRLTLASYVTVLTGTTAYGVISLIPPEYLGGYVVAGLLGAAGLKYFQSRTLDSMATTLIRKDNIESVFRRLYAKRIADKDEFTIALWNRISEHLKLGLTASELKDLPSISKSELATLDNILDNEVPNLRRSASPTFDRRQ
jgi:hypothetical protein